MGSSDRFRDGDKIARKDFTHALKDRPWFALPAGKCKEPKPITQTRLARMLKEFQIWPRDVRIGNTNLNGYLRKDFEHAWRATLPRRAKA